MKRKYHEKGIMGNDVTPSEREIPNILMAPSSSSSHSAPTSSTSCKYDVFLNFRGVDVRRNFVDFLYEALNRRRIHTYKDDQTLPPGESIGPSLYKAIEESQIAITVFSEHYASSTWCLDELAYIIKLRDEKKLILMPIFYNVTPSEMRSSTGPFASEFINQINKNKNKDKSELWRKALDEASRISGWEPKEMAGGYESKAINIITNAVLDRLFSFKSGVDDDLVGMRDRLQELEAMLDTKSGSVRMVGIWGLGGIGKTTLAISLRKKISKHFVGHCIVKDVRAKSEKHGLEKLQEDIMLALFKRKENIQCVDDGRDLLKQMLHNKKVLIVLDDVSDVVQLEALVGKHNWFGSGSRIIITTRNKSLLIAHRVDETYHVKSLSEYQATQLFKTHAYNEKDPIEDYKALSERVVSYSAGLPLALKVLGSFLYDKSKDEWIGVLDKLKAIPDPDIMKILRINYDGLEPHLRNLFLDIACFFRGRSVTYAMKILDACGYYPKYGIKVLTQHAFISIVPNFGEGVLEMHDLVQEMGHHIVRGEYPNSPEKHSRIWELENIRDLCLKDKTTLKEDNKVEAIYVDFGYNRTVPSGFANIVSYMKSLRLLCVYDDDNMHPDMHPDEPTFLSNELRCLDLTRYPGSSFPDSFQPTKLVILKLSHSMQRVLLKDCKHLPHLKELELTNMSKLVSTPDFNGLACLEELTLKDCPLLEEIPESLRKLKRLKYLCIHRCRGIKRFPATLQMDNLEILYITSCNLEDGKMLPGIGELSNLQELTLKDCPLLEEIPESLRKLKRLKYLCIHRCRGIKRFPATLQMDNLEILYITSCDLEDEMISSIGELSNLRELHLSDNNFTRLDFSLSKLTRLKFLDLSSCRQLLELPGLPSSLANLEAYGCRSLVSLGDCYKSCKCLREVTLGVTGINKYDGSRILETMLEGEAIENGCMILQLPGVEVAEGFRPPLVKGSTKCVLELPENWFNDFTGFLICTTFMCDAVWKSDDPDTGDDPDTDNDDDMDNDPDTTFVVYVSFGSLGEAAIEWWKNQTCKALQFTVDFDGCSFRSFCYGVRVRLVRRQTTSPAASTAAAAASSTSSVINKKYNPHVNVIDHDIEAGSLTFSLKWTWAESIWAEIGFIK